MVATFLRHRVWTPGPLARQIARGRAPWMVLLTASLLGIAVHGDALAQAKKESPPEAQASFADAANAQNGEAFDLAVDNWGQFLKDYPEDPLAPKARHYLGVCLVKLKRYGDAAKEFETVSTKHADFELLEETLLNLGWCEWTLGAAGEAERLPKAVTALDALVKKYPTGKLADQAHFFAGEARYAQGQRAEAIASYAKLAKDFPKSDKLHDTLYAMGVAHEELEQWKEAKAAYEKFLESFATSDLAMEIKLRRAEATLQLADPAGAYTQFEAVAVAPKSAFVDRARFRQGVCLSKQEKFKEAAEMYGKVVADHPDSPLKPEAIVVSGLSWYRAGDMEQAEKWLTQAVEGATNKAPEAAHWLAKAQIRQKKFVEAIATSTKALAPDGKLKAADTPWAVALRLDLADATYETPEGKANAMAMYAKLADENPQHELAPQARYNAAFAGMELKQPAEGIKHSQAFQKAYANDKLLPDTRYIEAECLLQSDKAPEAEPILSDLMNKHSDHAESLMWLRRLAVARQIQKKYPAAILTLQAKADAMPTPETKAESHYIIGACNLALEKFEEAAKSLETSLAASATWRQADEALLSLARAQRKLNKTAEAIATLERMLKEFPMSRSLDQARYRLGEAQYAVEKHEPALAAYDAVLANHAESEFAPYSIYGRGWSLVKLKRFQDASVAFTQLIDKHPQHALINETRFARAMSRRQEGNAEGAIEDLDAFLITRPMGDVKADALFEKGLAQIAKKDYEKAVLSLKAVVDQFPQYGALDRTLFEMGWAHKYQDKNAEAIPFFSRILKDFPKSSVAPESALHVGEDFYGQKKYDEAGKHYALAKATAPESDEIHEKATHMLGWSLYHQNKIDESLAEFVVQLALHPKGTLAPDGRFMRGECLFKGKKHAEALAAYREFLEAAGTNELFEQFALLHGAQSAGQVKQWKDAADWLTKLLDKHKTTKFLSEAQYELGWAKQNLGQQDDASKLYATVAKSSRGEIGARAQFMLGELLFEQKKHADAVKELQRVMFGYGAEKAPAEIKNWQAKAAFDAGRCLETQASTATTPDAKEKLIVEAKKMYVFVVDKHAQHPLAADAAKRRDALSKQP